MWESCNKSWLTSGSNLHKIYHFSISLMAAVKGMKAITWEVFIPCQNSLLAKKWKWKMKQIWNHQRMQFNRLVIQTGSIERSCNYTAKLLGVVGAKLFSLCGPLHICFRQSFGVIVVHSWAWMPTVLTFIEFSTWIE